MSPLHYIQFNVPRILADPLPPVRNYPIEDLIPLGNSAVKSQFGPQYNFKFTLFCNTTALQMSSITPL